MKTALFSLLLSLCLSAYASAREQLPDNLTYYVATTGADANDGLTPSTPFHTWQRAIEAATAWDIPNGRYVTVQIADGVYTEQVVLKTITGGGRVILKGNPTNHNAVTLSVTGADAIYPHSEGVRGLYELRSFRVRTYTDGHGLLMENAGLEVWIYDLNFDRCASGHIAVFTFALLRIRGDYTISGDAPYHFRASHMGRIAFQNKHVDLVAQPYFSIAFALQEDGGRMSIQEDTFNGSATGRRWSTEDDYHITTSAGANYLPGNQPGIGLIR